jgi:hypothetical protein
MSTDFAKYLDDAKARREQAVKDQIEGREKAEADAIEKAKQALAPLKAKFMPILERARTDLSKRGVTLSITDGTANRPPRLPEPCISFQLAGKTPRQGKIHILTVGERTVSHTLFGSSEAEGRWPIDDLTEAQLEAVVKRAIDEFVER